MAVGSPKIIKKYIKKLFQKFINMIFYDKLVYFNESKFSLLTPYVFMYKQNKANMSKVIIFAVFENIIQ